MSLRRYQCVALLTELYGLRDGVGRRRAHGGHVNAHVSCYPFPFLASKYSDTCTYTCTHTHTLKYMCAHTRTHIHTLSETHTHTHTHTQHCPHSKHRAAG